MLFRSTRGDAEPVGFAGAFAAGLAPDGGLYVPESLPPLPAALHDTDTPLPYPDVAFEYLRRFDTDHTPDELRALIDKSYAAFADPQNAAPLRQLDNRLFVLELFHGPTLAFKDFGLQLVGNLFEDQIRRTGEPICVLGATSGDTGAAAIHGLAGKDGVKVFILYPEGRISPLQERQMTCTGAGNIFPIAIRGSFDDAQRIVKDLFRDLAFKRRARLSAINSINLARVLAQAVYYIHAVARLPRENRERIRFVVPTGNFGNVFAGWLAARAGLPVERFTIATNRNDILHRLFTTGVYEPGDVSPSLAPSMDIQVASNFERLLFYLCGENGPRTRELMGRLGSERALRIPEFDAGIFDATRSSDDDIVRLIRAARDRFNYIPDPHTACAFQNIDPEFDSVVLATAHPAKFPETIESALGAAPTHPTLEALKSRTPSKTDLPADPAAVSEFIEGRLA